MRAKDFLRQVYKLDRMVENSSGLNLNLKL